MTKSQTDKAIDGVFAGCGCILVVIAAGLAAIVVVIAVSWFIGLGATIRFPADLAKIEQLRLDAANVDPAQAEDVIGQVTEWNQTIAHNQALNDIPIIGLSVPDEWDAVQPIEVPH